MYPSRPNYRIELDDETILNLIANTTTAKGLTVNLSAGPPQVSHGSQGEPRADEADQEPFVNQTLAYQALAMLARLFRYGRLDYHGSFVNLRNGRATPIPVDPRVWARMQFGGK